MDDTELSATLDKLRRLGGEPANVEVKTAAGGLPRSMVETVSALSNTNGGLIVLGLRRERGVRYGSAARSRKAPRRSRLGGQRPARAARVTGG